MQTLPALVFDQNSTHEMAERDKAIASVHGLIWNIVGKHYRRFGGDRNDMYQECVMLLCSTWDKYDETQSAFTTWTTTICLRHLRHVYALGRLNGPIIRVSIEAFNKGKRVHVLPIDASAHSELPDREYKSEPNFDDFVCLAETVVGRKLTQLERNVFVSRFIYDDDYDTIAIEHCVERKELTRLFRNFIYAARQRQGSVCVGAYQCKFRLL